MNPTVQRIQELFQQNDPSHYYWANFHKFLQSHSHKAIAALLNAPVWTAPQAQTLLAMKQGIKVDDWLSADAQRQKWLLLTTASTRRTVSFDGTPHELVDFTFKTIKPCWQECSAQMKFTVWNNWGSGIKNADARGQAFMTECMTQWTPESAQDSEWKVQALVGTFDELVDMIRQSSNPCDKTIEAYSSLMHQEVKRLNTWAAFSPVSVQTWRQLQGYPDFMANLNWLHPWVQSLSVVHTGVMTANLTEAAFFREHPAYDDGRMTVFRKERMLQNNPLNPDDELLAQALQQHFLQKSVNAAPSVQGLYCLLEGLDSPSMMSCLFNLAVPSTSTSMIDIDHTVFEYNP